MSYSKSIAIVLTTAVCAFAVATDAGAQSRGRSSGGRASVGRSVSRSGGAVVRTAPYRSNVIVRGGVAPLRSYYYPYYYGYRPGFSIGFGLGYPYYYGAYGYPYYGGYYGYSYGGYYPYDYTYAAPGYAVVPRGGYASYGGVRIQGAPRNAEVYVDGNYAGIVDDYNGTFQRLDLEPGSHEVEIRTPGRPMVYDVNVNPGQTVTIHANVR